MDPLGQLASVYVNEGKWKQRQRLPRRVWASLHCAASLCAAVQRTVQAPVWELPPFHGARLRLLTATRALCPLRPAPPAGFNVGSFRLRLGSGSGSAYVFNMTANSLTLQTQRCLLSTAACRGRCTAACRDSTSWQ